MASSTTQKALLLTELNKPLVLVNNYPIPEPSPTQIQIKVTVAGINPHDGKVREWGLFIKAFQPPALTQLRGSFMKDDLPVVLTNDVVGVVTKIGSEVPSGAGVKVGDRVVAHGGFGPGPSQNGLQEYSVADHGAFAKVPKGISDDEAATLPTNIIAPLAALFHELEIPAPWTGEEGATKGFDHAGTTLLVIGGGSSCGKFGVQLAALAGIGKIVVVGGPEEELKGYGATVVLDRHGGYDAVLQRIRDEVGDELVYAYDAVNMPDQQILGLNALSSYKRGLFARLLPTGPVDESKVVGKKAGFEVKSVFGSSQALPRELVGGFWERVGGWLEDGRIKPLGYVVKEGLTAENVNEVLDAYRDGKGVTKTHIHL